MACVWTLTRDTTSELLCRGTQKYRKKSTLGIEKRMDYTNSVWGAQNLPSKIDVAAVQAPLHGKSMAVFFVGSYVFFLFTIPIKCTLCGDLRYTTTIVCRATWWKKLKVQCISCSHQCDFLVNVQIVLKQINWCCNSVKYFQFYHVQCSWMTHHRFKPNQHDDIHQAGHQTWLHS